MTIDNHGSQFYRAFSILIYNGYRVFDICGHIFELLPLLCGRKHKSGVFVHTCAFYDMQDAKEVTLRA